MSNSNIFLKSGFPRAPLQNGISRYVCQLQRITIKYCKNNGASKGTRLVCVINTPINSDFTWIVLPQ